MRGKRSAEDAGWAPGEAAGGGFLEDETVAGPIWAAPTRVWRDGPG